MIADDIDVVSNSAQADRLGRAARFLAAMAGAYLLGNFAVVQDVRFKKPLPGRAANSNPASDADRSLETMLRSRLREAFPEHAIIGEELAPLPGEANFTWVIDPIDGTTNFINGLPLYAVSVGLLFKGQPLVGAIWCATTHELRPGVYHAIAGGELHFDGRLLSRRATPPWRGLAAEPGRAPSYGALWDTRVFGCATIELAWVAAGLLRLAYIPRPALWDVVAGLVLLRAAGCEALTQVRDRWQPFREFPQPAELSGWSAPLLIGAPSDLELAVRPA